MIPHTQTIFADDPEGVYGNCVQAAIASLLDLPLKAVPHFGLFESWGAAIRLWLEGHDRSLEWARVDAAAPGQLVMAVGKSPRGVSHAVVWGENGLVHDPHPDRTGLVGVPRYFYAIQKRLEAVDFERTQNAATTA